MNFNIARILRNIMVVLGAIFIALNIFALTSGPFYMHYALGDDLLGKDAKEDFVPERIVMMGGAGMPSASNLMRLYYVSSLAKIYDCPVIIIHPEDSLCHAKMQENLVNQGVKSDILHFTQGTNTRSQVLELMNECPELADASIVVVTSPEHIRRTTLCFKKVGFTKVRGVAAYEGTVDFNLSVKEQKLEGNELIPNVESSNVRYTYWNYLKLEIDTFREYIALLYYKTKGWI